MKIYILYVASDEIDHSGPRLERDEIYEAALLGGAIPFVADFVNLF